MKALLILFFQTLLIVFAGFVACNISAVVINDIFDGFESFFEQIRNLPYILYGIFSLIISGVLTLMIQSKTR